MKRMAHRWWSLLVVALIAPGAAAGPVWCETGEAGKTTATAEVPFGAGGMGKIKGRLDGTMVSGVPINGDFVDVYRIYIRFPNLFAARTVAPQTGMGFDTHLWLFDHQGFGLLANDDGTMTGPFSQMGNESTDATGVMILQPGIYYIAVSGPDHVPVSGGGPIFNIGGLFEVSGPDGAGGLSSLVDWNGLPLIGDYEIEMQGVVFPPCPGDATLDGIVDVDDLNAVLSNWNGPVPPNALGDVTGDGFVDVDDLNEVLSNWASTECFDAPQMGG